MFAKIVLRLGIAACFAAAPALAVAQEAPKPSAQAGAGLDAAPNSSAPDPLTPPEPGGPAPRAPGAPEAPPATSAEAAPLPEPDPIAAQILLRLSKAASKSDTREDSAGLTAFYTENKGRAIWTAADGLSPKALKAIHEIQN